MRATSKFCESTSFHYLPRIGFLLVMLVMGFMPAQAREHDDAEDAARLLTKILEKENFEFRAEAWVKELPAKVGKAVRMQLFKGNDYRFCVAVPRDSGVHVTAAVLDLEGKPTGEIEPVLEGWGCILSFKPKKTGVYVIAVREVEGGKMRDVSCAIITGYR